MTRYNINGTWVEQEYDIDTLLHITTPKLDELLTAFIDLLLRVKDRLYHLESFPQQISISNPRQADKAILEQGIGLTVFNDTMKVHVVLIYMRKIIRTISDQLVLRKITDTVSVFINVSPEYLLDIIHQLQIDCADTERLRSQLRITLASLERWMIIVLQDIVQLSGLRIETTAG
jgi:hypothetical protein